MKRIIPAVLIAIFFHAALFALDPGLLKRKPAKIRKPDIVVTMSYRKKPAPPPPVKKPPPQKKIKKKEVKVIKKVKEPAPVKEKQPVPEPEPEKKQEIVEAKIEVQEEVVETIPVEVEEAEDYEAVSEDVAPVAVFEATPLYKQNPEPGYPRMARKRGYQGTVTLSVLVNKDGTVDDLWLFETSGYKILDNAALKTVKDWTFEPGRRGDEAIEMWVEVPVVFRLE